MARSENQSGKAPYLSRKWRLMAAGAVTFGLAGVLVEPAMGEWWKLSRSPSPAVAPAAPENGFATTIRRLMEESRRAAEQGDSVKAAKLAERAAKISEAAYQVSGSSRDCSPEETARFAAEMKARRDGLPQVAAAPARPQLQRGPEGSAPPAVAKAPVAAVPQRTIPGGSQIAQSQVARTDSTKIASQPAKAVEKQATKPVPARQPGSMDQQLADASVAKPVQYQDSTRPNAHRVASNPTRENASSDSIPIPPSPTRSKTAAADDWLAQSRLAAADGQLDRAIELADLAIQTSGGALFGPAEQNAKAEEALRWRRSLIVRKSEDSKDVFELPTKIVARTEASSEPLPEDTFETPTIATALSVESTNESDGGVEVAQAAVETSEPSVEASRDQAWELDVSEAAATESDSNQQAEQASSSEVATVEERPADSTPVSETVRAPIRFARSVLTRSAWVDEEFLETYSSPAQSRPVPETNKAEPTESPANSQSAEDEQQDQTVGAQKPIQEMPSQAGTGITLAVVEDVSSEAVGSAGAPRPKLRLRSSIQQVAAEYPASDPHVRMEFEAPARSESPAPSQEDSRGKSSDESRAGKSLKSKATVTPAAATDLSRFEWFDAENPAAAPSSSQPTLKEEIESGAEPELPGQRFPVDRVMKLRERLNSLGGVEEPGEKETPRADAKRQPLKVRDAKPCEELESSRFADESRPGNAQPSYEDPVDAVNSTVRRPPLKLRDRLRSHVNEPVAGNAVATKSPAIAQNKQSTGLTKSPSRDTVTVWKAQPVGESKENGQATAGASPSSEQSSDQVGPKTAVAQVAFASPDGKSGLNSAGFSDRDDPSAKDTEVAPPPPVLPDDAWYREGEGHQSAAQGGTVVRKSSFASVDRLAESLKLPVSTMISIIGCGGLALLGCGLIALRAALRRRHTS